MAQTEVILLERIEKLGQLGEVVNVKPGYARNYLLPQKKALRATKDNIAYFDAKRKVIEAENDKKKGAAFKIEEKIKGALVPLIRQASEGGQLYGSVTSRDIAAEASKATGETIERSMVTINQNYKLIGLFPVEIVLHPEVKAEITINIARTPEEAEIQAKTGKALIESAEDGAEEEQQPEITAEEAEEKLAEALETDALEAEKQRQADEAEKAAEDAAKAEEKAAKKAEKAAAKAEAEAAEAEAAEEAGETAEASEDAPVEESGEAEPEEEKAEE